MPTSQRSYRWPKWCASGRAETRSGAPESLRAIGASVSSLWTSDVLVPLDPLEDAAREDQRLSADDRPVPLVDLRRDDQVHLAELVLEQHEDDAVRGRRPLAGHGHPGHGHAGPVRCLAQVMAGKDTWREVRAQELHRMHADGEARLAVVGEHLLPLRRLREARASRRSGRAEGRAGAPRRPSRARSRERGTRPSSQSSARRDVPSESQAPEAIRLSSPPCPIDVRCASSTTSSNGPPRPLLGERLRVVLADRRDVLEPDPHRVRPRSSTSPRSGSRPAGAPPPHAAARRGRGSPAGRSPSAVRSGARRGTRPDSGAAATPTGRRAARTRPRATSGSRSRRSRRACRRPRPRASARLPWRPRPRRTARGTPRSPPRSASGSSPAAAPRPPPR